MAVAPKLRYGWLLCILVSTVAALGIIFILMERFQTDPMMNSLEIRIADTPLDLPQIYLCPSWNSFEKVRSGKENEDEFLEQLYGWDFQQTAYNRNRSYPDSLGNVVHLGKFFLQNAPSCDAIIRTPTLSVGQTQLNCSSYEVAFTTAGICCVLQLPGQIRDDVTVSLSFNTMTLPIRMFATFDEEPELIRHLQLHEFLFPTSVILDMQETHTSPEARILTRSQRKCFFPGEQMSYGKCVLDCKVKNSLKFCGCVPWFLAKGGIKECQIGRYKCLDGNSDDIMDVSKCRCRQSCDNVVLTNVEVTILSATEPCIINIKERSVLKYERTVRFGWADLFVSFGGIAGLFLGGSLLTIIEFGYYFSLRTYCGAVLSAPNRRHNVTKINVLDVAHPAHLTVEKTRVAPHKQRVKFYDYMN